MATKGGGFTLWAGAGSAISATRGKSPDWGTLVRDVANEAGHVLPVDPNHVGFPARLELLSEAIGHATFRRALRRKLVDDIAPTDIDVEKALEQAVIAFRAGAVVSFNIDPISPYLLCLFGGGSGLLVRTLKERDPYSVNITSDVKPGAVGKPIYCPHGLLLQGNVVITKSEYDRHIGTLAMSTAVHLCIGTDLVILGMSLDDVYLRDAILQNRRFIRDIYWVNERFAHVEWARVANVTCVESCHSLVWSRMATTMLDADSDKWLERCVNKFRPELGSFLPGLCSLNTQLATKIQQDGAELASKAFASSADLTAFARYCVDAGFEIPPAVASDPRCRIAT